MISLYRIRARLSETYRIRHGFGIYPIRNIPLLHYQETSMEIIGNIHENPNCWRQKNEYTSANSA